MHCLFYWSIIYYATYFSFRYLPTNKTDFKKLFFFFFANRYCSYLSFRWQHNLSNKKCCLCMYEESLHVPTYMYVKNLLAGYKNMKNLNFKEILLSLQGLMRMIPAETLFFTWIPILHLVFPSLEKLSQQVTRNESYMVSKPNGNRYIGIKGKIRVSHYSSNFTGGKFL